VHLENVADDTKRIMTDEHPYNGIADHYTTLDPVNHHAEEWVRGDVHMNGIEGAWSLFKSSVVDSYHQVSEKHLAH
jgi:ISXO2-like transposase domain